MTPEQEFEVYYADRSKGHPMFYEKYNNEYGKINIPVNVYNALKFRLNELQKRRLGTSKEH